MNFKEDNLRFVLLKAMADAIADEMAELRAGHLVPLLERYDEDGTKSFSVRLPGNGALIAALTLPEPKDKYEVTDEAAFTAWFAENHPDAVDVVTIPGEPERTEVVPATPDETITTINPRHRAAILKTLDQTDEGEIVDSVTGSFVKGVKFTAGKRPDKFSVNYEDKGREYLGRAYRAGELDDLVGGTSLPPINGRVIVERVVEAAPEPVYEQTPWKDMPAYPAPGSAVTMTVVPAEDLGPVPGEQAADFDPGSWGAPSDVTGPGW